MQRDIDSGTETVRSWIVDGVGVIELNRPERRNALHPDMYDAIPRVIERFEEDSAVRCMLITGAGTSFCAGGDVRGNKAARPTGVGDRQPPPGANPLLDIARMVLALHESPKLSIAALPGPAVGAGVGIALAADLRIAARSARLVTGFAALGFSGDFGSTWFLTRLLGPSRALQVLVDNATIDSDEAVRLGLFSRVVPDADLRGAAMEWAKAVAEGPATAFQLMKENVRDALALPLREALPLESERMARSAQTDDHRRAVKRWLERAEAKKPPPTA